MTRDVADPIALSPYAWTDIDFRVELNAHLKIALENGLWDGERACGRGIALEAADHCVVIAFLGWFGWCYGRSAVDGFMKDGVVGVVLLHSTEVVGTFEQVLTLTGSILCPYRLTIDALRRQTLRW